MRIPILNRESSAFIKLRRLGYSISVIAQAFGRSTSVVQRRIRKALEYGIINFRDLRKIPNKIRQMCRARQERILARWISLWNQWILGEGERPP